MSPQLVRSRSGVKTPVNGNLVGRSKSTQKIERDRTPPPPGATSYKTLVSRDVRGPQNQNTFLASRNTQSHIQSQGINRSGAQTGRPAHHYSSKLASSFSKKATNALSNGMGVIQQNRALTIK